MPRRKSTFVGLSLQFGLIALIIIGLLIPFLSTKAESAGYALQFDGVDDYIRMYENDIMLHPDWPNLRTASLWIFPTGAARTCANSTPYWCDMVFGDAPRWWGISRGIINGLDRLWIYNFATTASDEFAVEYTPNEWVHIAWVHEYGVMRVYKNGELIGSIPSHPTGQPATDPVLQIGGFIKGNRYEVFQGLVDEVRVWNIALTQEQIASTMYQHLTGAEEGLAAYYQMSNGAGQILTDDSINAWDGTFYGAGNGMLPQWVLSSAFDGAPATSTPTETLIPSDTPTPTETTTPTDTATEGPSPTPTDTATPSDTPTPTDTSTITNTPLPSDTPTETSTPTNSPTPTNTPTATNTPQGGVLFADGFESGDLSAWSGSVTDGGDLYASAAAAVVGAYGLQADVDNNAAIYVRDDTPNQARSYQASFWFDPNSIAMVDRNNHFIFQGDTGTSPIIRIAFAFLSGSYQVQAMVKDDNNMWRITPWVVLSDGPHHIELGWSAASAPGANDGSVSLAVDGANLNQVNGLDNDNLPLDRVFWGGVSGIDTGTRGTYFFDEFVSYP